MFTPRIRAPCDLSRDPEVNPRNCSCLFHEPFRNQRTVSMDLNAVTAPIKSEPSEEVLSVEQQAEQLANMTEKRKTIAKQSTSMANQSEDSRSAEQTKLFLSYSTRDQLTGCLNLVSTILESNKPIPEDAKSRTCKKIKESISLLTELLPFESTLSANDSSTFEEQLAAELTIKLFSEVQPRLINHLLANRNIVLLYDKATDEAKRSLISQNERIILQLVKLSHKKRSNLEEDENIIESPSKRQRGW